MFVSKWLPWSFENPAAESYGSLGFSRGRLDKCKGPVSLLLLINLLCNGKGACWRAWCQLNLWRVSLSLYLTHTANKASFTSFFLLTQAAFWKANCSFLSWKERWSPITGVSSANEEKLIKNLNSSPPLSHSLASSTWAWAASAGSVQLCQPFVSLITWDLQGCVMDSTENVQVGMLLCLKWLVG